MNRRGRHSIQVRSLSRLLVFRCAIEPLHRLHVVIPQIQNGIALLSQAHIVRDQEHIGPGVSPFPKQLKHRIPLQTIQGTGCFVEDQHRTLNAQGTQNGEPLLLTAAQIVPSFQQFEIQGLRRQGNPSNRGEQSTDSLPPHPPSCWARAWSSFPAQSVKQKRLLAEVTDVGQPRFYRDFFAQCGLIVRTASHLDFT